MGYSFQSYQTREQKHQCKNDTRVLPRVEKAWKTSNYFKRGSHGPNSQAYLGFSGCHFFLPTCQPLTQLGSANALGMQSVPLSMSMAMLNSIGPRADP